MNVKRISRDAFKVKGASTFIILASAFGFISSAAATINIFQDMSNLYAWVSLAFSAPVYFFATTLIIGDILNAHQGNRRETYYDNI